MNSLSAHNEEARSGSLLLSMFQESWRTLIFEDSQVAIALADQRGRILDASRAFHEIYGYKEGELKDKPITDLIVSPELREGRSTSRQDQAAGQIRRHERVCRKSNGAVLEILCQKIPVRIDSRSHGFLIIHQDITLQKNAERVLKQQIKLEKLMSRINMRFLSNDCLDQTLWQTLRDVGLYAKADRAYIFLLREGAAIMDNTHEWCRRGVIPQKQNLQNLRTDTFPWWMAQLRAGKTINIPDVARMPGKASAEKSILEKQNIRSVLVLPLSREKNLYGFMGLDTLLDVDPWDSERLHLIETLSGMIEGVLQRHRTSETMRETKLRYDALFDRSNDGVFLLNMDGIHTAVNQKGAGMLGYQPHELIGRPISMTVSPQEHGSAMNMLEKLQIEEAVPIYKRLFRHREGHDIPVEINVSVVKDEKGHPQYLQSIVRDIRERTASEKSLRESEKKYRELVERGNDGITILQDGLVRYANPRLAEIFGGKIQEILNRPFMEFVHPDSRDSLVQNYRDRMAGKEVPSIYEATLLNKDGGSIQTEINAGVTEFQGETADLVFVRDVSQRKKAEFKWRQALDGAILSLAKTLEMRDPYTAGHQQRVADLSCRIAGEMGMSRERIEGMKVAGLIHDIGKISIPAEILSKPGRLTETEFALIKSHPQVAYDILKNINFPWPVAEIVYQHHEYLDGSGYPRGLPADRILLEARILTVADVVEAMASNRPYRPALGIDIALEEINKGSGSRFDAAVVEACLHLFRNKGFSFKD